MVSHAQDVDYFFIVWQLMILCFLLSKRVCERTGNANQYLAPTSTDIPALIPEQRTSAASKLSSVALSNSEASSCPSPLNLWK